MTYGKVNDIIMRDIVDPEYEDYAEVLKQMNNLAHILRNNKVRRGYIDFGVDEDHGLQCGKAKLNANT